MLTRYRRTTPTYDAITRDPFLNLVDRFFHDGLAGVAAATNEATHSWVPAMDIVETEEAYLATADLPGLRKDDIDISVEDGVLTISGERTIAHPADEATGFKRFERASGSFRRAFTLPQGVDLEKVNAAFADGVLTVTLPKSEIVKARKVAIS
ncbi:MAG: Hsp20/alpha crystallin family protein [Acidobacteriota bacterium]